VLFVIDQRPYQADYDRARAGLELARSQYELAKLEAARAQKLKELRTRSVGLRKANQPTGTRRRQS
jgi:multidrug efflux system membrane fusion protein